MEVGHKMMKPAIFGLSSLILIDDEKSFFTDVNPAGYILFKRNIENRDQVKALTDSLRALHGRDDVPILIDQEGGRVARMQSPVWPEFPAGRMFDAAYDISPMSAIEAARNNAEAIAILLAEVGINVNAMPMLDVRVSDTHEAIGDRSFGGEPQRVAAMGRAVIDGLRKGGVVGIVKHMPGQGRAAVDSHHDLPRVTANEAELEQDLSPFHALCDAPMGMTGHVVFEAWDKDRPATMSPTIIYDIIRTRIRFDGLLMSDDLQMNALSGDVAERAANCIKAGCDIALYCSGDLAQMVTIAGNLPEITDAAKERLRRAMATISDDVSVDLDRLAMLIAKRDELLAI
jgi:beta-N-acetylhexosaminidase